MNLTSPIGRLRVVGAIEGASFLLLLFVAMPMKYLAGQPMYVSVVGALHGGLWLAYLAVLADVRLNVGWSWSRVGVALLASVLPFGPFILDPRLREEQQAAVAHGR
jgi:integral membrane protein